MASNPTGFLAAFFLGIFLGVLIATIGLYASIVKVTVDGAISQPERSGLTARSSYSMGSQPTLTAAPVLRKYCPNCGNSIPGRDDEVSELRSKTLTRGTGCERLGVGVS